MTATAAPRCSTAHEPVNLLDDQVFDRLGERPRTAVINHRVAPLVAAFLEHAERRHVPEHIVAIAGDPQPLPGILAGEPDRVIDDDFPAETDEREIAAEPPDLDGVALRDREAALAPYGRVHQLRVATEVDLVDIELTLPALPGSRVRERQIDRAIGGVQR